MNQNPPKAADQVLADLKCMHCGYSLRGLELSKTCPECGLAIAMTIAGPGLQNASPFFLHRVMYGVTGVAAGVSLLGLVYAVRVALNLTEFPPSVYEYWLGHVATIAWVVRWFSAMLLLAPREKAAGSEYESELSARKLLLYAGIILFGIEILPTGLFTRAIDGYRWYRALLTLLDHIAEMMLLLYVFTLVRRSGDALLKRHYPYALAAIAVGLGFNLVLWYVWYGFRGTTLNGMYLVRLGSIFYMAILLFRMRKTLLQLLANRTQAIL
jgi:hypothetical protein